MNYCATQKSISIGYKINKYQCISDMPPHEQSSKIIYYVIFICLYKYNMISIHFMKNHIEERETYNGKYYKANHDSMTIFEKYTDLQQFTSRSRGRQPTQAMTVTIYKYQGSFNLSRYAYESLGCPSHVLFYYSHAEHTGIITRAIQSDTGALKLYLRRGAQTHHFNGKLFCNQIGISLDRLHRYGTQLQDGALVIHLDREIGKEQ